MSDDLYRLIPEDGKHLADSHNTEGAVRGVYLDDETNKPCGAGEFIKVNPEDLYSTEPYEIRDDSDSSNTAALIALGFAAGAFITTVAYPRVKEFVTVKVIPKAKKILHRHKDKTLESSNNPTELEHNATTSTEYSIDSLHQEYRENIDSEEAKKELLEAFIYQAISARKIWRISHANIIDYDGTVTDGKSMIDELTNPNLLSDINNILINNYSLIAEQQILDLSELLGYNIIQNGQFIPISQQNLYDGLTKQD